MAMTLIEASARKILLNPIVDEVLGEAAATKEDPTRFYGPSVAYLDDIGADQRIALASVWPVFPWTYGASANSVAFLASAPAGSVHGQRLDPHR